MRNRGWLPKIRRGTKAVVAAVVAAVVLDACSSEITVEGPLVEQFCELDPSLLANFTAPNLIPALTEPNMVAAASLLAGYLEDDDRVLGVVIAGEARAYPHNILWWHEIINDRIGTTRLSVSFCPLTGSGLVFDPQVGEGNLIDLGVSGILFANNLMMFDRRNNELYGPQLAVEGKCGNFVGGSLNLMPVQEMSWGRWKALHPSTRVVSQNTGWDRDYPQEFYPYGDYRELDDETLLFPMTVDESRPIKERVLAIRDGDGGRGYPFGELATTGSVAALNEVVAGIPTAIFYEQAGGEVAIAFDARVNGQTLTFDADPAGFWTDQESDPSTWDIGGLATAGPLAGEQLTTLSDAYVLFWFAWRHFQPNGTTYIAP